MGRLIVLLMITALAAACSGTDSTADTSAGDTSADVAATDNADSADTGTAVSGEIDAGSCQEAADALQALPLAVSGAATGQVDAAEIQAQADAFAAVADKAPAEISGDLQTIGDAYTEIATTLSGIDLQSGQVPSAEDQAALQELSTVLSDGSFTTASTNVATFFANGCQ